MFKNKVCKQVEAHIQSLQLNLENNYKDLAIEAKKDAYTLLEEGYADRKISVKRYGKYKKILDDYQTMMQGYNHQQFYRS